MKKTITVNIKGFNFSIEEEAFLLLQEFLDQVRMHLANNQGAEEILEDIEVRIAELCHLNLQDGKQVVTEEEIKIIIQSLGKPSDFGEDNDSDENENNSTDQHQKTHKNRHQKRLYRIEEDGKIGGVCAGIAHYFNIDITVVRVVFLLFLIMGFGFILYAVLWICIPAANSSIDMLRMSGKAITLDNIRDEVSKAATRIKKEGRNLSEKFRQDPNFKTRFSTFGKIIRYSFGTVFLAFALLFTISMVIFFASDFQFIPVDGENGFLSISDMHQLVFRNGDGWWAMFVLILGSSCGVLLFYLSGISFFLRKKNKYIRIASLSSIMVIVLCVIGAFIIGPRLLRDYSISEELEREIGTVNTSSLIVHSTTNKTASQDGFKLKENGRNFPLYLRANKIIIARHDISFRTSKDSLYHIFQEIGSHGKSSKEAISKAKNIEHFVALSDSVLLLPPQYSYPKQDLIRGQYSKIIIEVPVGKQVILETDSGDKSYVQLGTESNIKGQIQENGKFERY